MALPFFNAAYYLAHNPDVVAAGYTIETAERHYQQWGAAESVNDPARAPNPWFNVNAYLAAYPDLAAQGITAATAFQHYVTYGIIEGRLPAPNVNPAEFSYADYAKANADLRTALGITDPDHLTVDQQHALFAHFLSYGYLEHRPGIDTTDGGSFFAAYDPTPPIQGGGSTPPPPPPPVDLGTVVDGTHVSKIYIGTAGADAFTGTQAHLEGTTLQGLAGGDALSATALTGALNITLNSVETIQADLAGDTTLAVTDTTVVAGPETGLATIALTSHGHAFTYGGAPVGAFALKDNAALTYHTGALSAADDVLGLSLADGTTSTVLVDGSGGSGAGAIERYNATFEGAGHLTLNAGDVNGGTLTVNLLGGGTGAADSLTLNGGTAGIQTVVVDGSAVASDQTIVLDASFSAANTTVTGGSGNDTLSAVADANHIAALIGGAGNDTLNASAGQDTMTGGLGADKFQFAAGTATYTAGTTTTATADSITDLQVGDTATLAGTAHIQADWSIATIASNHNGVIVATGAPGLANFVLFAEGQSQPNAAYLFQIGADAYFLNTGDSSHTNAQLVKLANTLVSDLQFTNGGTGVQRIPGPIVIDHVATYTGTGGDDTFQYNGAGTGLNGVTVDGLANNDTFNANISGSSNLSMTMNNVENLNVTATNYFGDLQVAGSGLSTLTVGGDPAHFFSYTGANVNTLHLVSSANTIVMNTTNTPGANDSLAVAVDDNVTSRVNVNAIEHVDLALGSNTNISLTFGGGNQNTEASVTVTGGATNSTLIVAAPVASSAWLTSVVVNAAAVTGDQTISLDPAAGGNINAMVTAGSGNDTLSTATDAAHTATLIGGAGADILNASAGQDTMTGGQGADKFQFAASMAAAIGTATATTVDTITDFQLGDTVTMAGSAHIQADWSVAGQLSNHNGIIAVDPGGPQTLDAILTQAAASSQANAAYLFQFGADTYFLNTGDGTPTTAQWVKLANTLASAIHLTNGGSGVEFTPPPIAINNPLMTYTGSTGDDVFTGEYTNVNGSTIQGQAGTDTLNVNFASAGTAGVIANSVEKIAVTLHAATAQLNVTGSVDSVSVLADTNDAFTYQGDKVNTFTLLDGNNSTLTASFNAGVSGSNDTLNLTTAPGAATTFNTFTANGIEHYNVALSGLSASLVLGANAVDGGTLSVVLTGGGSGAIDAITMDSTNSVGLNTVTVDASGFVGGFQYLDLGPNMASANVFVTGSGGDDTLSNATDATHNATVNGGLGADLIYASLGIDKLTGGGGDDIFYFRFHDGDGRSRVDSGVLVTDEITDFTFGDVLQFATPSLHIDGTLNLSGVGTGTNNGIFVFQTAPTTLAQAQTALDALAIQTNVVFKLADGSVYYMNTNELAGAADDTIVKLTGVDITKLTVGDLNGVSGVHYTPL